VSGFRRQKAGARCDGPNAFFCAGPSRLSLPILAVADSIRLSSSRATLFQGEEPWHELRAAPAYPAAAKRTRSRRGPRHRPLLCCRLWIGPQTGVNFARLSRNVGVCAGGGRPRFSLKVDRSLKGLPQSWIVDPCDVLFANGYSPRILKCDDRLSPLAPPSCLDKHLFTRGNWLFILQNHKLLREVLGKLAL